MKSKKNWYTLLEIMIVLWVIIVIMTITMKFSSSRIDDLHAQTSKDDFKNSYEQLLLSNMSSNYHNKERYNKMMIYILSWANWFTYNLENENEEIKIYTWYFDPKHEIINLKINNSPANSIEIALTPYQFGCQINNITWTAIIQTQSKNRLHCFKLATNNCKLEYIECQEFYPDQ